jgi:hypothetical protein
MLIKVFINCNVGQTNQHEGDDEGNGRENMYMCKKGKKPIYHVLENPEQK